MRRQIRWQSFWGFGLMFSLLLFAPEPSFAGCRNSGGSSGSKSVGSQVNGGSVTICASAVSVTPARTATVAKPVAKVVAKTVSSKSVSSKAVPKSVPKSSTPANVVVKTKPAVFRRTQAAPIKPVAGKSKTVVTKVATKTVAKVVKKIVTKNVTTAASQNKTAAAADFTPASVSASVYPSDQLSIGQTASFSSSAVIHYRTGTLLNLPTEVRFTPVSVAWDFDSGGSGSGSYVGHAFNSAGEHQVQVLVTYSVSYRLKGSLAWIAEPDTITLGDNLVVTVADDGGELSVDEQPEETPVITRRVGSDCIKRPGTFGCG